MFPAPPNFKSGKALDAWAWWKDPIDKRVWVILSSWSAIVRKAQEALKDIFAYPDNPVPRNCDPNGWLQITKPEDFKPDGRWGDITARYMAVFLCATGNAEAATRLARDIVAKRFSAETLRFLLWLAFFVSPGSVDLTVQGQKIDQSTRDNGAGLYLDPATQLPDWSQNPADDPKDKGWWAQVVFGDKLQLPPSMGGGTFAWPTNVTVPEALGGPATTTPGTGGATPTPTPTPPAASGGSGGLFLLAALALGGYMIFGRKESSDVSEDR